LEKYSLKDFSEIAAGGKGRIPWARLQAAQGDFVLPEYLPDGCTLTQFHHIRIQDANALLKHWTQRQAAGEVPFRFRTNVPDIRGKRASADVITPTPAGQTDQPEGDDQGAGRVQERESDSDDRDDGDDATGNVSDSDSWLS
jgi:hypothetical protein